MSPMVHTISLRLDIKFNGAYEERSGLLSLLYQAVVPRELVRHLRRSQQ